MSKAGTNVRRRLGLDKGLQERLHTQSALLRVPEEQADIPSKQPGFCPKPCLSYGLCICAQHRDVKHMSDNCKRVFRHVFWRKRKQDLVAPQRIALEALHVVLEFFRPMASSSARKDIDRSDIDNDWDSLYLEDSAPRSSSPASVFAHVGHINLRTFHFAVLRMLGIEGAPAGAQWLQPLQALEDESIESQAQAVRSDMQLFTLLDLQIPWSLRIHVISDNEAHWIDAPIEVVAIRQSMDPIQVWQGSAEEAPRSGQAAAAALWRPRWPSADCSSCSWQQKSSCAAANSRSLPRSCCR